MKVEFAFQCGMNWDDMEGGDRVRHCSSCDHAVHDLSQMTRSEARKFLERTNGEACVSFICDEEGAVVTKPERPQRGARGKFGAAVLTLPLLLAGCDQPAVQPVAQPTAPAAPVTPTSDEATRPTHEPPDVGAAVRTASKLLDHARSPVERHPQQGRRLLGVPGSHLDEALPELSKAERKKFEEFERVTERAVAAVKGGEVSDFD